MAGKTKSATGKSINTLESEARASSTLSLKYIITNDDTMSLSLSITSVVYILLASNFYSIYYY